MLELITGMEYSDTARKEGASRGEKQDENTQEQEKGRGAREGKSKGRARGL